MINPIDDKASDAMRFFLSQKAKLAPYGDRRDASASSQQDEAIDHPAHAKDGQDRTSFASASMRE